MWLSGLVVVYHTYLVCAKNEDNIAEARIIFIAGELL